MMARNTLVSVPRCNESDVVLIHTGKEIFDGYVNTTAEVFILFLVSTSHSTGLGFFPQG